MEDYSKLGLFVYNDFLTKEEENDLLKEIHIKSNSINKGNYRNFVKRYGSDKPYKSNIISKDIPEYLLKLSYKMLNENKIKEIQDSITVNQYLKGQKIELHIDTIESGDVISIISLMGPAVMVFKNKNITFRVQLLPRSLVQLTEDIRWKWLHGIDPVFNTRYSIVFRKSKENNK